MGRALAYLAPQIKGNKADRGASRIIELLGKTIALGAEPLRLSNTLAALAPCVKSDQAERGANRIIQLMGNSTANNEAAYLGGALAELVAQVQGEQMQRGALLAKFIK